MRPLPAPNVPVTRRPNGSTIINIIPELPNADNEYTPAQRRAIDARLAEARKGPYYGPFKTADEAIALRHREIGRGGTGTSSTVHGEPGDRLGEFGLGTVKPVPVPAYF